MIQMLNYIIEKGKNQTHWYSMNSSWTFICLHLWLSGVCCWVVSAPHMSVKHQSVLRPLHPCSCSSVHSFWLSFQSCGVCKCNYYYFWLIITIPKPDDLFSFGDLLICHSNSKDTDLSPALVTNKIANAYIPFRCIIATTLLEAKRTEMQQMKQHLCIYSACYRIEKYANP